MKTKRTSPLIGFRHANWAFAELFFASVEKYKIKESELARLAIEKGLAEATEEIAGRRKAKEEALNSMKKGLKLNFNWPLTPRNSSAVLVG